jgi:hypothetical protein
MNQSTLGSEWAKEVFGHAQLGDARLSRSLVRLATAVVRKPAGTVSGVVEGSAAREAAYRLLESDNVGADAVSEALCEATVRACIGRHVFVVIEGSSLSLTNRAGAREVGSVGARKDFGQGLICQTALAVSRDGTPIGIAGQTFWAREAPTAYRQNHSMETETRYSVELFERVAARFAEHAPDATPWFVMDRGYDAWAILETAARNKIHLTVRAA